MCQAPEEPHTVTNYNIKTHANSSVTHHNIYSIAVTCIGLLLKVIAAFNYLLHSTSLNGSQ